jgi:hypothetical protein
MHSKQDGLAPNVTAEPLASALHARAGGAAHVLGRDIEASVLPPCSRENSKGPAVAG